MPRLYVIFRFIKIGSFSYGFENYSENLKLTFKMYQLKRIKYLKPLYQKTITVLLLPEKVYTYIIKKTTL